MTSSTTESPASARGSASLLEQHLRDRREQHPLLVPYVMAGIRPDWTDLLTACVDAGADAVEVGLPFSDPLLDGPTIQAATVAALENGTTAGAAIDAVGTLDLAVPPVVMTYANLAYHHGLATFLRRLSEAGVRGLILPDVPLEEAAQYPEQAQAAGIAAVQLVAPASDEQRLRRIVNVAQGFVYAVSIMGTTGERSALASTATSIGSRVRAVTDLPVLVGFGVSTPEQAVGVARSADGVVVASALMRAVLDGASAAELYQQLHAFRTALDAG